MGNVLSGNLGQSFVTHRPVASILRSAAPIDLESVVLSQVFALGAAVPLAMASAKRPGSRLDRLTTGSTFALLAVPPFIMIVVLVLAFSVHLHVFPEPSSYVPLTESLWANLYALLLPALVLALGSLVIYYRILRSDLITTLQEDFITVARAKGLSERYIMWRHALRPSSIPLVASAGLNSSSLIAGTFVVEFLLAIPGLGFQLVNSVQQSDYLAIQGIVLFVAVVVVLINFIVDLLFAVLDPRIARA